MHLRVEVKRDLKKKDFKKFLKFFKKCKESRDGKYYRELEIFEYTSKDIVFSVEPSISKGTFELLSVTSLYEDLLFFEIVDYSSLYKVSLEFVI